MRGKSMIIPKDGDKVHEFTYIFEVERGYQNKRFGRFICSCGNVFETNIYQIVNGLTKSCGCKKGTWNKLLTNEQVLDIRKLIWKDQLTLIEIAKKFNVSIGTIFNIKVERTYKDVA